MIVRKRKTVTIEVEVDITADWRGESGGGKPPERWIEWFTFKVVGAKDDGAELESFRILVADAIASIPEEELAE